MNLTLIIILITVGTSLLAWNNPGMYSRMLNNPYRIVRGEFYRIFTSGFIHAGYIHLGFNMFTLYFFGNAVETIFGQVLGGSATLVFIIYYVSAIAISDITTIIKYRNNPNYNSLGASGAVSAMVFTSILYMPLVKICIFGIFCLPGFILGILYIIYSYTQGKNMADNINHDAHLYGAIYGIVFGLIIYPQAGPQFFEQILDWRLF